MSKASLDFPLNSMKVKKMALEVDVLKHNKAEKRTNKQWLMHADRILVWPHCQSRCINLFIHTL